MEREKLYRGKGVNLGKWVYGKSVLTYGDGTFIFNGDLQNNAGDGWKIPFKGCVEIHPETLGEFTGREINGVKLFEDDFFKVGNHLKVVKFFNMGFHICNVSDMENEHTRKVLGSSIYQYPDENWWRMFNDEIYIIGNVHE